MVQCQNTFINTQQVKRYFWNFKETKIGKITEYYNKKWHQALQSFVFTFACIHLCADHEIRMKIMPNMDSSGMCHLMSHSMSSATVARRADLWRLWSAKLRPLQPCRLHSHDVTSKWEMTLWQALWLTRLDITTWFRLELLWRTKAHLLDSSHCSSRCHCGIKWHMSILFLRSVHTTPQLRFVAALHPTT